MVLLLLICHGIDGPTTPFLIWYLHSFCANSVNVRELKDSGFICYVQVEVAIAILHYFVWKSLMFFEVVSILILCILSCKYT